MLVCSVLCACRYSHIVVKTITAKQSWLSRTLFTHPHVHTHHGNLLPALSAAVEQHAGLPVLPTSTDGNVMACQVVNPATGELIAKVPEMRANETKAAIAAASAAWPAWCKKTAKERGAIMRKCALPLLALDMHHLPPQTTT